MWWRFLTFCVLVSFILFVVASCIYGRPSFHLFFHRCCGDDIENDQVIFENFGNNFLKERLIGGDIIEADNETLFENEDIGRITDEMKEVLSINDPEVKKWIANTHISDNGNSDTIAEDKIADEQINDVMKDTEKEKNKQDVRNNELLKKEVNDTTDTASTLSDTFEEDIKGFEEINDTVIDERKIQQNKLDITNYELLEKEAEEVTETASNKEFLNVHDWKHKRMVGMM